MNIPRGYKRQYVPCLNNQSKMHQEYQQAYNPFSENTKELGESLLNMINTEKRTDGRNK